MAAPGPDKPRCPGHSRTNDGAPCQLSAGWGTDHLGYGCCRFHGGSTRAHKKHIAEEMLEDQARRVLASLDVRPVNDPLTELSLLAGQVTGFKDRLSELVNKIDPDQIRYTDEKGAEQLRSEMVLWERALDRCNTVLTSMAKLRIDERLAAITERQAEAVLGAIQAALDAVGVPRTDQAPAKAAAARHLRLVKEAS